MRTTIDLPDHLHAAAKMRAALRGTSLKQFFIEAVSQSLAQPGPKLRKPPPAIGDGRGPKILPTPEQIDEAMFG